MGKPRCSLKLVRASFLLEKKIQLQLVLCNIGLFIPNQVVKYDLKAKLSQIKQCKYQLYRDLTKYKVNNLTSSL